MRIKNIYVGAYVQHWKFGYGEITTIDWVRKCFFVDFANDRYGWFSMDSFYKIFKPANDKSYVKVKLGYNGVNTLKDILNKYGDYKEIYIV